MQLIDLAPGEFGVEHAGIYIIDNGERAVLAGPFDCTADAITWIERAPRARHGGAAGPSDEMS